MIFQWQTVPDPRRGDRKRTITHIVASGDRGSKSSSLSADRSRHLESTSTVMFNAAIGNLMLISLAARAHSFDKRESTGFPSAYFSILIEITK
jgi:hypothetical protein